MADLDRAGGLARYRVHNTDHTFWPTACDKQARAVGTDGEAGRRLRDVDFSDLAGIEVDYTGDYRNDAIAFVRDHAFDFTIGAVHYLETANISEPRADEYFQTHSAEDAYTAYFAELRSCAETAVFDCIAHPDLIKRFSRPFYGTFDPAPCMDLLTEIMQILIDTGTAMEINTSGLRQGPEDLYPCDDILQLYAGLGGTRVTVGSDAHVPEHVGYGLDRALSAIEEFGLIPD